MRIFATNNIYRIDTAEVVHGSVMELIDKNVPPRFNKEFKKNAVDVKYGNIFTLYCIAIAKHESLNFKILKSPKNKDGSIDYGPMGLNSYNIKDPSFMKAYSPEYHIKDKDVLYMVVCINLFKELYMNLGEKNGLLVYNAGYGRYYRKEVPVKSYEYREIVYNKFLTVRNEFEMIYLNRLKNEADKYLTLETRFNIFLSRYKVLSIYKKSFNKKLVYKKDDDDGIGEVVNDLEILSEKTVNGIRILTSSILKLRDMPV